MFFCEGGEEKVDEETPNLEIPVNFLIKEEICFLSFVKKCNLLIVSKIRKLFLLRKTPNLVFLSSKK